MVIGAVSLQLPLEQRWIRGTPMMQAEVGWGVNRAAGNRFMRSPWQLEVEHGFAEAIPDKGVGGGTRLTAAHGVKISYIDSCRYMHDVKSTMMSLRKKGNALTGGKCRFRPHVFFWRGGMCRWQAALMQPGEIGDERRTSCAASSGSCLPPVPQTRLCLTLLFQTQSQKQKKFKILKEI